MAVERRQIDGKWATVGFMDQAFNPCDPDEATFAKIIFDDGQSMFVQSLWDFGNIRPDDKRMIEDEW